MSHLLFPLTVLLGALAGWLGLMPPFVSEYSLPHLLLYALIIQVGLGLGMRPDIKKIIKGFNPRLLLLPVCTIVGTLSFTFLATLLFKGDSSSDLMAIGSGFGYYTLSSVLIVQFKEAAVGPEAAASIAAIALLTNVVREMFALISCQYLSKKGHGETAISVAGINSMDVCLPMIVGTGKSSDTRLVSAALFHGLILEISVPVLISLFCG
ncbi:MAG: lysine exporter LysO family protein [Muribaculaceae bacterium]|nr:lysine exporter LysO family protein [Muribaculaceae bacterium]